jgi:glycosyltransferase involved in cell wall biosynthesis
LAWGRDLAPGSRTTLVPSIVPADEERAAEDVYRQRNPEPGHLVYVGMLRFPVNSMSLEGFLNEHWPAMRLAQPALRLTVVGDCPDEDRERFERHPEVTAAGFVEDLVPLLARCNAVVMPFSASAGTSLRAAFYALAGVPVIGTPGAFRGLAYKVGLVARTSQEWSRHAADLFASPERHNDSIEASRAAALAQQRDAARWDDLAQAIDGLAGRHRLAAEISR